MLCRNTPPYIVVVQLRRGAWFTCLNVGTSRRVRAAAQGDISLPDINLALNRRL